MNIKQIEKITGVSSQNIRYYEKEKLIAPQRNHFNRYREYGEEEVQRIKLIKMLRMLDMPLKQIRSVLEEDIELPDALAQQQNMLETRMTELKAAIAFCDELKKEKISLQCLDVDKCLEKMEQEKTGFFAKWLQDYKAAAEYEHNRHFSFVPDGAVTNEREFTNALFQYADKNNMNLVILKEGMYPEFTIDGERYCAQRNYSYVRGVPLATIMCERAASDEEMPQTLSGRKKRMCLLHIFFPGILCFLFILIAASKRFEFFSFQEKALLCTAALLLCGAACIRNYYLYWNMR